SEREPPRLRRRFAVAASGEQAAKPPDYMAQRDSGREDIARRPQRQADAADVPKRDDDGDDQAAVEDAARPGQREQLARIGAERFEIGDEQQELRPDESADDDVDAEVEDAVRIESASFGADHREFEAQKICR